MIHCKKTVPLCLCGNSFFCVRDSSGKPTAQKKIYFHKQLGEDLERLPAVAVTLRNGRQG